VLSAYIAFDDTCQLKLKLTISKKIFHVLYVKYNAFHKVRIRKIIFVVKVQYVDINIKHDD